MGAISLVYFTWGFIGLCVLFGSGLLFLAARHLWRAYFDR